MKIKTSELSGYALDWAVAMAEKAAPQISKGGWVVFDTYQNDPPFGIDEYNDARWQKYSPSNYWSQGGWIIEREWISLTNENDIWTAEIADDVPDGYHSATGHMPLIAAMRCYVTLELGGEVDVPEELIAANPITDRDLPGGSQ